MDTTTFDFTSIEEYNNGYGFDMPAIDPLNTPLDSMSFDDIDTMDIYTFHPQSLNSGMITPTLMPVTDIFGFTRVCDPMSVDIMSGLPADAFPQTTAQIMHEQNQAKLEESSNLNKEMDIAVDKYHDAIRSGDYEEALKWERIANDKQSSLYDLWDTPRYSPGPARAPGL